jgi:hypothetical protein
MNTIDAFLQLSHTRGWYKDLGITKEGAASLIGRVRKGGSITNDKLEEVLTKAGWKIVQEKQWAAPGAPTDKDDVPMIDLKDRPPGYLGEFISWNYLHSHMIPADATWPEMYKMYDLYLSKLKYQRS